MRYHPMEELGNFHLIERCGIADPAPECEVNYEGRRKKLSAKKIAGKRKFRKQTKISRRKNR